MDLDTNSNRVRIIRLASVSPGVHLREIERLLHLSLHSVRHHVEVLTKSGLIVCDKERGYSRIFPVGTTERDIVIYSYLRVNSTRKILVLLSGGLRLTNKDICERTGLAKSTVSESIQKFLDSHIIQLELSDSGIRVGLQDNLRVEQLIKVKGSSINSNDLVDNFIELFDF